MKRIPIDCDLSTSRMPGEFWVPPRTRDAEEAERRRGLRPGELVYEHQQRGLLVARKVLEIVEDDMESRQFAAHLAGASALNSVWHTFAEPERYQQNVRRKRLHYAWLSGAGNGRSLLRAARHGLRVAEPMADHLRIAYGTNAPNLHIKRRDFGQKVGDAALELAVVAGVDDTPFPDYPLLAQRISREYALRMIEGRHDLARQVGTAPTLAQFADRDSDVSVFWRRNAPDTAYQAYDEAQSEVRV